MADFTFVNKTASSFEVKHVYQPLALVKQLNLAPVPIEVHQVAMGAEIKISGKVPSNAIYADDRYERVIVIKRTSVDIVSQTLTTLPKLLPDALVEGLKLLIPHQIRPGEKGDTHKFVASLKKLIPPPLRPKSHEPEPEAIPDKTIHDYVDILKKTEAVISLVGLPADEKLFVYPTPFEPYTQITTESLYFLKLLHSALTGSQEALAVLLAESVTHPFLLEALQAAPEGLKNLPKVFGKVKELVEHVFHHDDKSEQIKYRIRTGPEDGLCQLEAEARQKRIEEIRNKLKLPDASNPPIVSTVTSGGGMRALIASVGFYTALKDMGFLDAITYTSSLSGSTWSTSKWMNAPQNPFVKYRSSPDVPDVWSIDVSPQGGADLDITGLIDTGGSKIKPVDALKIGFEAIRTGSLLMGYATLLQLKMNVDVGEYTTLGGGKASIGKYPIPVYCACFMDNHNQLQWADFTPFEIGSTHLTTYFDPTDFKLYAADIPPHLSQLMAVWGSAFYCTFVQLLEQIGPVPDWLQKVLGNASILKGAQTANANYNQKSPSGSLLPMANQRYIYYRDGGILANLPVPPITLRPERGVSVTIILDTSAGLADEPFKELIKAIPGIASEIPSNPTYPYLFPANDIHPTLIYIPVLASSDFNPNFNPENCSTFSFEYDEEMTTNLQGLAYYWTVKAKDIIAQYVGNTNN